MPVSTSGAEVIPQYLRHRAKEDVRRGVPDGERLGKLNRVLHSRILRMHQDKLCSGCALFVITDDKFIWDLRWWYNDPHSWEDFEVIPGSREEARLLAKNPRTRWNIALAEASKCTLCNVFFYSALPALARSSLLNSRRLFVELRRGIF
jgi:hypothetical protein